jgi:hypothetical protein
MPNLVAPRGFVPSRYLDNSPYSGGGNMYYIPSSDGNQYSPGDAVKSAAGGDANGIPQVVKAAGTDTVRGVILGVFPANPNSPSLVATTLDLTVQNIPASKTKDYYVLVADDPKLLFEISDDGLSALTAAACNKNASFTVTNPTAPQQNSASVLSTASVAPNIALPLKLVGLVQRPDNAFGAYAKWLVVFNQHELGGCNTAGV